MDDRGKVTKLQLVTVGEDYRFEPDAILDAAKGNDFDRLVIIGEHENGELYIAGTANAGESMILMERAKMEICGAKFND